MSNRVEVKKELLEKMDSQGFGVAEVAAGLSASRVSDHATETQQQTMETLATYAHGDTQLTQEAGFAAKQHVHFFDH